MTRPFPLEGIDHVGTPGSFSIRSAHPVEWYPETVTFASYGWTLVKFPTT
jgi:hypothetical protein